MGVTVYDFSRIVPIGEAKNLSNLLPTPREYHKFLLRMYNTYKKIKKDVPNARFGTKDPLWMLLYQELGLLKPLKNNGLIYGGCSIGINGLCIDVNGDVYSCRRLGIPLGNIKSSTLYDLFINSQEMNHEREYHKIEGCKDCSLISICRGCRAIAYHVNKSYFAKDPSCWKIENEK